MIIDAHAHCGTGSGMRGPWDTEARIEPHLERARAAGIDRTVVFPVFDGDYAAANARLARIVRRYPRELIGFAAVHPVRDAGRITQLVGRAVEGYGFRGIKVHGHDALPGREVGDAARRFAVPVLVDVVGQVGPIEMFATHFPDVAFIIPHLGAFSDNWTVQTHVTDQLRRFPNVFADTSGVRYFDQLARAARLCPGKLIFGSDGPLLHPAIELVKIRMLNLPAAAEARITGGTIARLIGLAARGHTPRRPAAGVPAGR
jgi:predicted TIM-barrel fold metal-dependent hydrolase